MIKKPYDVTNVKYRYILNGKCYETDKYEIRKLIKIYNRQEVLFGPVWCKGVFFYLTEKKMIK